jgi:hypothetical protein
MDFGADAFVGGRELSEAIVELGNSGTSAAIAFSADSKIPAAPIESAIPTRAAEWLLQERFSLDQWSQQAPPQSNEVISDSNTQQASSAR